jgi:hypothetical protein
VFSFGGLGVRNRTQAIPNHVSLFVQGRRAYRELARKAKNKKPETPNERAGESNLFSPFIVCQRLA